jgi:8-oxo-dGTP diphosphatase
MQQIVDPQRPRIGVGVIVMRGDHVLLGKRQGAHGAGTWSFPGGHLEWGESIDACARREVLEETGVIVRNTRHVTFTNDVFEDEGKHYVTLYVAADYESGAPKVMEPEKSTCWEWFSWDALPTPLFLPVQNLFARGFDPATLKSSDHRVRAAM